MFRFFAILGSTILVTSIIGCSILPQTQKTTIPQITKPQQSSKVQDTSTDLQQIDLVNFNLTKIERDQLIQAAQRAGLKNLYIPLKAEPNTQLDVQTDGNGVVIRLNRIGILESSSESKVNGIVKKEQDIRLKNGITGRWITASYDQNSPESTMFYTQINGTYIEMGYPSAIAIDHDKAKQLILLLAASFGLLK